MVKFLEKDVVSSWENLIEVVSMSDKRSMINFDVHLRENGRKDTVSHPSINYIGNILIYLQICIGYDGINILVD